MCQDMRSLPQCDWNAQTAQGESYLLYTYSKGLFLNIYIYFTLNEF